MASWQTFSQLGISVRARLGALLAPFKYYAFDIFFEGSYGNGFSPMVGTVGLLRTGLVMLLPASYC